MCVFFTGGSESGLFRKVFSKKEDSLTCLFSVPVQIRVGGEVTDVELVQLTPSTAYSISLYALHGEAASDALEGTGVTCESRFNH